MKSFIGNLAELLESFFLERLMTEKDVSPHTVVSYRDTFRLLLQYLQRKLGKEPSALNFEDITAPEVLAFLLDLEKIRGCSARSRNHRLTAIRSFFRYLAYRLPDRSSQIQQVLAIPNKRTQKCIVDFLSEQEISAILARPDQSNWIGRRDYALMSVAIQTGLRVSELTSLRWDQISLKAGAHIRVLGKGRKQRSTPLTKQIVRILSAWKRGQAQPLSNDVVFPSASEGPLSSDAVQRLLRKYVTEAIPSCSSLSKKRVSPHVLRHSTAMRLLHSGASQPVIALWLGHESVETTQVYLKADLKMKEKILKKTAPIRGVYRRFKPGDRLLNFLKDL